MLLKVNLNTYSSSDSDYKLEIVTRLKSYKLCKVGRVRRVTSFVVGSVSRDILTKKGSQGKSLSKEEI